jgi:hypothetical protein
MDRPCVCRLFFFEKISGFKNCASNTCKRRQIFQPLRFWASTILLGFTKNLLKSSICLSVYQRRVEISSSSSLVDKGNKTSLWQRNHLLCFLSSKHHSPFDRWQLPRTSRPNGLLLKFTSCLQQCRHDCGFKSDKQLWWTLVASFLNNFGWEKVFVYDRLELHNSDKCSRKSCGYLFNLFLKFFTQYHKKILLKMSRSSWMTCDFRLDLLNTTQLL